MVSRRAGQSRRTETAQRRPALIAHAGLGIHRPGGAPDAACLQRARVSGADAIELDLCVTADGALMLHHDLQLPSGTVVASLTRRQLRRLDADLLTLEEGLEILGDDVPIVLDVKTRAAVEPLLQWFSVQEMPGRVAVCTERAETLGAIARASRGMTLWRTFPELGTQSRERVRRVAGGLLAHRGTQAVRMAGDLLNSLGSVRQSPQAALAHVTGLPWRRLLPDLLPAVRRQCSASGVSVHHSLVTRDLCLAGHALGLSVSAWTINAPQAALRAAACGVDFITTDAVDVVADALAGHGEALLTGT